MGGSLAGKGEQRESAFLQFFETKAFKLLLPIKIHFRFESVLEKYVFW
jgi:hypothetical protein